MQANQNVVIKKIEQANATEQKKGKSRIAVYKVKPTEDPESVSAWITAVSVLKLATALYATMAQ